jgi:iron(III) transport system substrate-binding protein
MKYFDHSCSSTTHSTAVQFAHALYRFTLSVGLLCGGLISAQAQAQTPAPTTTTTAAAAPANQTVWDVVRTPSAERTARLKEFAKAEGGSLSIYTSIAERDLKIIFEPFEKKYGIKVNIWRASGDSVLARTITEARGKRYTVDVFHAGAVELEALSREHLLQKVASPHFVDLAPGSLPENK